MRPMQQITSRMPRQWVTACVRRVTFRPSKRAPSMEMAAFEFSCKTYGDFKQMMSIGRYAKAGDLEDT